MIEVKEVIGEKVNTKSEFKDIYMHRSYFEDEQQILRIDEIEEVKYTKEYLERRVMVSDYLKELSQLLYDH